MNKIKIFNNPQFGEIRTAGTADNPLFCLSDLCRVLDIQNVTDTKNRLRADGLGQIEVTDKIGRKQFVYFVNEQNLYKVIMRSDKPQAEPFQDWVCGEVLPSIRKTGGYIASNGLTDEEIMARALSIAQQTMAKREERIRNLEMENREQMAMIEQKDETIAIQSDEIRKQAPKVNYYDQTLQSVNTMTTTQVAKCIGMEVQVLNRKLKEAGIIFKQSGQWMLRSPYTNWNLHAVRTQTYTRSDGSVGSSSYTVWTEKGKRFIVALFENEFNPRKAIAAIKNAV